MKRFTIIGAMVVIIALAAITIAGAREVCTGEKYEGHPALQQECLHQQTVNQGAGEAYPGPEVTPAPYPPPETQPPAAATLPPICKKFICP